MWTRTGYTFNIFKFEHYLPSQVLSEWLAPMSNEGHKVLIKLMSFPKEKTKCYLIDLMEWMRI